METSREVYFIRDILPTSQVKGRSLGLFVLIINVVYFVGGLFVCFLKILVCCFFNIFYCFQKGKERER